MIHSSKAGLVVAALVLTGLLSCEDDSLSTTRAALTVAADDDGDGIDAVGNVEPTHTLELMVDSTAPVAAIARPAAVAYPHSGTLVLDYWASDDGSGLQSVTATMDGATTIAGHGLTSGQTIDLLMELGVGDHVFAVDVLDHVGNHGRASVTFSIIVTPQSMVNDVNRFLRSGDITLGDGTSLRQKLMAAAAARARGECATASHIYRAFVNELAAQSGKHVSAAAAEILAGDARYLMTHCP